jgi:hypothetical protein
MPHTRHAHSWPGRTGATGPARRRVTAVSALLWRSSLWDRAALRLRELSQCDTPCISSCPSQGCPVQLRIQVLYGACRLAGGERETPAAVVMPDHHQERRVLLPQP